MFGRKRSVTVIAEGLKIEGNVTAEGSVELHGLVEGELHCTSLRISRKGRITGKVDAGTIFIDGTVDGPVHGTHVTLEPHARVTGDVHHESFAVEKGAFFDGRSRQKQAGEKAGRKFTATKLHDGADPKAGDGKEKGGARDGKGEAEKAPAAA